VKQQAFENLRRPLWQRFAEELDGLRLGYRLAEGTDREAFLRVYQRVARDLALVRARGYSRKLEDELNDLVLRGHNVVYVHRAGFAMALLGFLSAEFPRAVRRQGAGQRGGTVQPLVRQHGEGGTGGGPAHSQPP